MKLRRTKKESRKLMKQTKNNSFQTKDLILIFLPILITFALRYLVFLLNILFIFIANVLRNETVSSRDSISDILMRDYNQPMNQAGILVAKYLLYFLIFGLWYYMSHIKKNDISIKANSIKMIKSFIPLLMMIMGFAGQLLTDGFLSIARPHFPKVFSEYDKLLSNVTGINSSMLMLVGVILIAPIAEEILFRGIIQKYCHRCLLPPLAILLQGLLFGFYHGNTIQCLYASILGAVLGYIAYKFDSLIPGMILHIFINLSILFVPMQLFATTLSTYITTFIALAVFILGLVMAVKVMAVKKQP